VDVSFGKLCRKVIAGVVLISACLAAAPSAFSQHGPGGHMPAGGELKHGRYVGTITFDDTGLRLGVIADLYLESPEDFREFPKLNAMLKFTFGGFGTHEYDTEVFQDLKYDFDNGVLTFDEMANDFMITSVVHNDGGSAAITGQVYVRSAGMSGNIELRHVPPGFEWQDHGQGSYVPAVDGEFVGTCDSKAAMVQVQSARGLLEEGDTDERVGINKSYRIVSRLAIRGGELCGFSSSDSRWCTYQNFDGGTYSPFIGKLLLESGNRMQECTIKGEDLDCSIVVRAGSMHCKLQKNLQSQSAPVFFERRYHVLPTNEQRRELPPASPPSNEALSEALRGNFTGYIHNETNDKYQAVRLNVMAYSSTDNPHNPNQMMVTTTAQTYLDRDIGSNFMVHRYEARSFYLRPGFTLNGASSDSFINVVEWRRGFIRGVWYSHSFGRVGTVEMVKGNDLPSLPVEAKLLPTFVGEFSGPNRRSNNDRGARWFKLLFPAQPGGYSDGQVHFRGSYQTVAGETAIEGIRDGAFDPYTGRMAWVMTRNGASTLISGSIRSNGHLDLFWPPVPNEFGTISFPYVLGSYSHVGAAGLTGQ
jgi:hypothetical protein